jgi:hypothetical protein
MQRAVKDIGRAVAEAVAPAYVGIANVVAGAAKAIATFVRQNQGLVRLAVVVGGYFTAWGAALQAGRESGRDLVNQQIAGYGAAGGLGSSRAALANANLAGLQEQRQATAAASARAGVQANKAAAAQQLASLGGQNLTGAQTAAASRIGFAGTPQDVYSKYASVIFGTPQQSTTPNFAGTQGGTTTGGGSSKGFGFSAPQAKSMFG